MNRNYHLVFTDPFITSSLVSKYLSEQLDLEYIRTGHLFGGRMIEDPKITRPFLPIFTQLILAEAFKTDRNLVIPDHPGFMETMADVNAFIATLLNLDLHLSHIWYVRNTDVTSTIQESARARNKIGTYAPGTAAFYSVLENAQSNQAQISSLMDEVSRNYPIYALESDSLMELKASTIAQIDSFLL
jgi:hypothetical protein